MEMMILMVIISFFAMLGLVDFCVGAGRWLHRTRPLDGTVLVVEVTEEEQSAEALLLQAADLMKSESALRAARMAVICRAAGENEQICRSFCEDRELPLTKGWEELGRLLAP